MKFDLVLVMHQVQFMLRKINVMRSLAVPMGLFMWCAMVSFVLIVSCQVTRLVVGSCIDSN